MKINHDHQAAHSKNRSIGTIHWHVEVRGTNCLVRLERL